MPRQVVRIYIFITTRIDKYLPFLLKSTVQQELNALPNMQVFPNYKRNYSLIQLLAIFELAGRVMEFVGNVASKLCRYVSVSGRSARLGYLNIYLTRGRSMRADKTCVIL